MSVLEAAPEKGTRRFDGLWLAGVAALLPAPVSAFIVADMDGPLVVGNSVLRRWHLVGGLLVLGILFVVALWYIRESRRGHRARRLRWRIVAGAITTCAVGAGVLAFLITAFLDMFTTYTVLPQHGADGCRVVVGERSVLLMGEGAIYVLPAGSHSPREVNSYFADDGYRPITFGTYRLTWNGDIAELTVWGMRDQPVDYASEPLSCG
ncbi:hypothetical protein GCM10022223_61660 [Kineosporia mesophila]|uniref:DUF1109 domain-containing protein n=1 Tax=Kineosporia mesophila TaxID=566012 RepID=A0ABP7AKL7_9ACTN|nr:hypothetical protein [Kineosporia mesophila]MCD5354020.1 hypothetical protein [Kineosporia mesophila]